MHKTTIFIVQLCVVFELFVVKVVKRHFRLNFVTSQWVQANIDFHLMKLTIHYGVVCGKSQSQTILIDQPKGQHGNILEFWRLESMEIVGTGRHCI